MKKYIALLLALCMIFALCACGAAESTTSAEETTSSVSDDGEEYTGFDLELAQAVCDIYGWELKKQPIDWDSKDMELNSGAIDCIWNGFTMTGREKNYTWSDAYLANSIVMMTRSDTGIKTLKDLEGKRIVTQAGSSALDALTKGEAVDLAKTFDSLEEVPDYNTAVLGLDSGLYDAVAIDIGVARHFLNGGRADGADTSIDVSYLVLDEAISTEQYGIGFKKGNKELRDAILAGVYQLLADGTLEKIAAKPEYKLSDMLCLDEANAIEFDMDSASAEMKARTTLTVGFDAEYPPFGYRVK